MTTATKPSLHAKLTRILDALDWIPKGGHNDRQNYDYTRQADVASKVRAAFVAEKVTCVPEDMDIVESRDFDSKGGGRQHFLLIRVKWALTDSETGEVQYVTTLGGGTDSGDKAPYKAMTGASKYAALLSFLIPTGDDPEKPNDTDGPARTTQTTTQTRGRSPRVTPDEKVAEAVKEVFKDDADPNWAENAAAAVDGETQQDWSNW